jgi:hypothetical protein
MRRVGPLALSRLQPPSLLAESQQSVEQELFYPSLNEAFPKFTEDTGIKARIS